MGFKAVVLVASLFVVAPFVFGCASAPAPREYAPSAPAAAPAPASSAGGSSSSANSTSDQSAADRMVVRTASLTMVVADVDDTLSKVAALAKEMGGFVVSSQSYESDGDRYGQASLRVPAPKLDESLGRLKQMATKVPSASTKDSDVTQEYMDQDARLRNLKATEAQYLELMKSAKTTEDVIKIQNALTQVRQQIDQTQGRIQYLQRTTEMALITLSLSTSSAVRPIEGEWDLLGTIREAAQALVDFGLFLAGLAIWIIIFVPIWVPVLLIVRWWRRRGRRPVGPPTPISPPGAAA